MRARQEELRRLEDEVRDDSRTAEVWRALLALTDSGIRAGIERAPAVAWYPRRGLTGVPADSADALLRRGRNGVWRPAPGLDAPARAIAELYTPVATAGVDRRCYVVGHLGQSLDGRIATSNGDSNFVTGPENLDHLHRMRALSDAIIVGAETVSADDPELTTRRVEGPDPVRIVLDPRCRLPDDHRVFNVRSAETWRVCGDAHAAPAERAPVRSIAVPIVDGALALDTLLERLHAEGIGRVFVEGGGATVSRFLEAGLLDRLQVAVAALVIGRGRPGLDVAGHAALADCLRPHSRVFAMGRDMLFDCEVRLTADAPDEPISGLRRIT